MAEPPNIIELKSIWTLGSPIKRGGFAPVYEAIDQDGRMAAIKVVPKEPGAKRELLFESLPGSTNIIPIWETGELEDDFVLVMPRADCSLRDKILEVSGVFQLNEALPILVDIATGLASLESNVVHRDIKPENILLYQGHWCIADFGIAKYIKASTSENTRKGSKTKPYAAPEQWREEIVSSRTDVYALGIIAYEMITGSRPFLGPDFRQQHLTEQAPPTTSGSVLLDGIIADCLRKSQQARPTSTNLLKRLARCQSAKPVAQDLDLAGIDKEIIMARATAETLLSSEQAREQSRAIIFGDASAILEGIVSQLCDDILAIASTAVISERDQTEIDFGKGKLRIRKASKANAGALQFNDYPPVFEVVAYSDITISQPPNYYGAAGRSHSLWYCDAEQEGVFRWYELSFMGNPMYGGGNVSIYPFALYPGESQSVPCFYPISASMQLAWSPCPIDQDDSEQFLARWKSWFSQVATGQYQGPQFMPDQPPELRRTLRQPCRRI